MTVLVQTIRSLAIPDIDLAEIAYKVGIKMLNICISIIGVAAMILLTGILATLWIASNALIIAGQIISQLP